MYIINIGTERQKGKKTKHIFQTPKGQKQPFKISIKLGRCVTFYCQTLKFLRMLTDFTFGEVQVKTKFGESAA